MSDANALGMAASWLARRERPKSANAALQSSKRTCQGRPREQSECSGSSLRTASGCRITCLGRFGALCIHQTLVVRPLGMPGLQMTCCDVSEEFTSIAREHWQGAGVAERINLQLAPAQQTLDGMIVDGQQGQFDFAYIDADKSGYRGYVESCLELVRSGGLITIDNVLWSGSVADPDDQSEDTVALRDLNSWLYQQAPGRFDLSLVPIGDGLTLLRKF